jgi:hypothetical protein
MSEGFREIWQAIHDEDARFGGVALDAETCCLAYSGRVVRKGILGWQKNKLDQPAEVQAVRLDDPDEPLWSCSIGEALDVSAMSADESYRALQIRLLGLTERHLVARLVWRDEEWLTAAIGRDDGALLWTRLGWESAPSHRVADSGLVWGDGGKRLLLLDLATGEARATLLDDADEADAVSASDSVAVFDGDDRLSVFDADGQRRWTADVARLAVGHSTDRVLLGKSLVIVAEPGAVKAFDAGSGAVKWQAAGPPGPHLALAAIGEHVVVQDVSSNRTRLLRARDGEPVDSEAFESMLHWMRAADGTLLGPTSEGALVRFDIEAGKGSEPVTLEGLGVFDVQQAGSRLLATATTAPKAPMVLVELDPSTLAVKRRLDLDEPGEVALRVLSDTRFALISNLGVTVYAI